MIRPTDTTNRMRDVRGTGPTGRSQGGDFSRSLKDVAANPSPSVAEEPPPALSSKTSTAGFVRSSASSASGQVPRFESVPESAQWPQGPYKQAPAEFGGEWWLVNPFSGPQPWVRAAEIAAAPSKAEPVQAPEEFVNLFGTRPDRTNTSSRGELELRTLLWDRKLENFQGVGVPEGYPAEQVSAAISDMKEWGMGEPVFYKSRDVWKARFPDSSLPEFEISPETAIKAPQVAAGVYHVQAILHGIEIENRHPLVPSGVFPLERYTTNA